jgi:hypothetical protein
LEEGSGIKVPSKRFQPVCIGKESYPGNIHEKYVRIAHPSLQGDNETLTLVVGIAGFAEHLHPNVALSLKFTDDLFPVNQFIGSPAHGECEFCFFSLVAPNEKGPREKEVNCFFSKVHHYGYSIKGGKMVEVVEIVELVKIVETVEVVRPRCQRSEIREKRFIGWASPYNV